MRAMGLNPIRNDTLCDTQIIVLSVDVNFCLLLVCLFTLDIGENAHVDRCHYYKKKVFFDLINEVLI